jgi:hypothetical protein
MATLYSARLIGPEILEAGTANTVACPLYRDGALVAPSSGTLTVWNTSGTKVLDAVAATITASVATVAISSGQLAGQTNSDAWRFEWALTIGGVVSTFRTDGALVYRRLYPVITDVDLLRAHTDLTRRRPASESSYQDYLDEAWARIEGRLIASGKRPWLILAPSALREVHLYLTLHLVFNDFATGGTDSSEWSQAANYATQYETAWGLVTYPQADPDGGAEGNRRRNLSPTVWLTGRA